MLTLNMVIFLIVLLALVLIAILAASFFLRDRGRSASQDAKTLPIVQKFYSEDLKKRAFIIRLHDGKYKVVFYEYSDKVINLRGEVAGWLPHANKPVFDSLYDAVDIAQKWTHGDTTSTRA